MCDLRKVVRQVTADPLRKRCIATKFRILRLERFHLLEPEVEILVAHGGDAFLVIKAACFFQLLLQFKIPGAVNVFLIHTC